MGEFMKRYYYDDPLAAAWMAKHFGMKFYNGNDGYYISHHSIADINNRISRDYKGFANGMGNHYVCADSLHLLNPKIGDIVRYWVTIEPDYFSQSESKRTKEHIKKLTKATMFYIKHQSGLHKLSILQRSGIIFHQPKENEVTCAK